MTSRAARAIAGLAVAGLFVALLARRVAWAGVRHALAGASPWPLVLGLAALTCDMAARITRWWLMLRAVEPDLPLASCVRPFLGSLSLNNTMPLRAGDIVRVVGFRRTLRAPVAHVAGTLVLERMLDLLVLLAILLAGVAGNRGAFPRPFLVAARAAGALTLAVLLALTLCPGPITGLLRRGMAKAFDGRSWLPGVTRAVDQVAAALALLRSPARAARLVGLSVAAWLLEGAVFACAAWSLHLGVPWQAPWLALGAGTLATLLPSSPGYVGTFDYFASLGLIAYGAPAEGAAAFALVTHLLLWVPVTVVGLAALATSRRARPVRRDSRAVARLST
jgi:glycosyltransferase 2 family protein